MLLLHGGVTVNESALTGESIPQIKEPLDRRAAVTPLPLAMHRCDTDGGAMYVRSLCRLGLSGDTRLDVGRHGASLVLGGTKVLQHTAGSQRSALQPPGGGAVGFVLRTGFQSSQASV